LRAPGGEASAARNAWRRFIDRQRRQVHHESLIAASKDNSRRIAVVTHPTPKGTTNCG
jgi:hypothetical protein